MSESEEMYLLNIARLGKTGEHYLVPLSVLSEELEVQPASAHQMVRKLEDAGWVTYEPYKGVGLTPQGLRTANRVLRYRRLWEVFLVEHLKIPNQEAFPLACRMEHFVPVEAGERLAIFLGNPTLCPDGEPIPPAEGDFKPDDGLPLSDRKVNDRLQVTQIRTNAASRTFLSSQGIRPETHLIVEGIGSDGALLVNTDAGSVFLSLELAKSIWTKT
jgi:DtxR family transcriptional regulator, Mn-dependent transcriptional regulator